MQTTLFHIHKWVVIGIGLLLIAVALVQTLSANAITLNFILLLGLAALAQYATTSVNVSSQCSIIYSVASVVAIACIPFFGLWAAVLVAAVASISIWLIKPTDSVHWKKQWSQLGFNVGMHCIAVSVAGAAFLFLEPRLSITIPAQILLWAIVATAYVAVNNLLLLSLVHLQNKGIFKVRRLIELNMPEISIDLLVMTIGGGLLMIAIGRYDWLGIIIFYTPILLSAYAFRLKFF